MSAPKHGSEGQQLKGDTTAAATKPESPTGGGRGRLGGPGTIAFSRSFSSFAPGVVDGQQEHLLDGSRIDMVLFYLYRHTGVALPKALVWACLSGLLAGVLIRLKNQGDFSSNTDDAGLGVVSVGMFVAFVGYLVIVRLSQAWSHFLEAADMVKQVRAQWVGACSNVLALCNQSLQTDDKAEKFKSTFVTLLSLLFATSMSHLSSARIVFHSLKVCEGLDFETLNFLKGKSATNAKTEVITQWLQRMILEQVHEGVLPSSPALISQPMQQLSQGLVQISRAEKVKESKLPSLYSAMITLMLLLATILVPLLCGFFMKTAWLGACGTVFIVFLLWCLNYLALEIDDPFGPSANSVPLAEEVSRMNTSLRLLLEASSGGLPYIPLYKSKGEQDSSARVLQEVRVERTVSLRNMKAFMETDDYEYLLNGRQVTGAMSSEGTTRSGAKNVEDEDWKSLFDDPSPKLGSSGHRVSMRQQGNGLRFYTEDSAEPSRTASDEAVAVSVSNTDDEALPHAVSHGRVGGSGRRAQHRARSSSSVSSVDPASPTKQRSNSENVNVNNNNNNNSSTSVRKTSFATGSGSLQATSSLRKTNRSAGPPPLPPLTNFAVPQKT